MKKIFYLLVFTLLSTGIAFASFPVTKEAQKENKIELKEQKNDANKVSTIAQIKEAKKIAKENKVADQQEMDNDTLILIILWLLLGGFAAHRWYAGKPVGANILFILTAGGCGIWAIIDLIKIIKGDFMS